MKLYRYQIWVSTPTGAKTIAPWDPDNLTLPRIIQDDDGEWCSADEAAKLEAINAQLLEALEEMVRITDGQVIYSFMAKQRDAARAAIAKAKGEQP